MTLPKSRRRGISVDVPMLLMLLAVFLTQILLVWLAFNFFGRAFKWPRIDFFQAGALLVLFRSLIPSKEDSSK